LKEIPTRPSPDERKRDSIFWAIGSGEYAPSDSLGPPWKGLANSYTGFKSKNAPEERPPAR